MSGFIHHISITCINLERSENFYKLLGFKPYKEYEDNLCSIVLLKGENGCIELFQFKESGSEIQEKTLKSIGLTHIAIRHTNLIEIKESLINFGCRCKKIKNARLGGFSYFFTSDPDDNLIEIIEED